MKKTLLLSALILFLALPAVMSQRMAFSFGGGISTTRMDDMKYLQKHILGLYPVEGAIISSFPTYGMVSLHLHAQLNSQLRISGGINYSLTGGRSNYSDSTGSLSTDMTASSSQFELAAYYKIIGGDFWDVSVFGSLGANRSLMDINTSLAVLGYSDLAIVNYTAISACGSAGMEARLKLNSVDFALEAGYNVDMPGKLKNKEDSADLTDPDQGSDRILATDWTGWQVQLKLYFWLKD